MTPLTVFFCGTSSTKFDSENKSYWNGELVSTLAKHNLGKEFAEWIVVDGPGSGNLQADEQFFKSGHYGISGTLLGSGWEENVKHALQIAKGHCSWERTELTQQEYNRLKDAGAPIGDLEKAGTWFWRKYYYGKRIVTPQQLQEQIIKMHRKGKLPTSVNLVGWSRGAVSCHMMANQMFKDDELKNIPVNIFAIDPVPGPKNFQAERVTLGSNVKEYVGFFARDERSVGFSCVIPRTDSKTRTHIYPMAGRHATLVGNAAANGNDNAGAKDLTEPGLIVRHFAEVCLTRWGVNLDKKLNLSKADLENHHNGLRSKDEQYKKMQKVSYTYFTELDQDERKVSHGNEGTAFSRVQGGHMKPASGLSASLTLTATSYQEIG